MERIGNKCPRSVPNPPQRGLCRGGGAHERTASGAALSERARPKKTQTPIGCEELAGNPAGALGPRRRPRPKAWAVWRVLREPAAASDAPGQPNGQPKTKQSSPNANGPRGTSRWSAPTRRPPHAWHRAARLMHRFATVLTREKAGARQRRLIAARGTPDASESQRAFVARPHRRRRERRKLLAVALRAWELAAPATVVAPNRESSPCRSKGWTTLRS
jgi:hypothetical protein